MGEEIGLCVSCFQNPNDVLIDRDKILQVLLNLLRNASPAVRVVKNGFIKVYAGNEEEKTFIRVIDNGERYFKGGSPRDWGAFFYHKERIVNRDWAGNKQTNHRWRQ